MSGNGGGPARSLTVRGTIRPDGTLHLDVEPGLPPGPVEVYLLIQSVDGSQGHRIRELRGLGAEIWSGLDAQDYVNALREEWERR